MTEKMFFRLSAVFICLCLMVGVVSGCNGKPDTSKTDTSSTNQTVDSTDETDTTDPDTTDTESLGSDSTTTANGKTDATTQSSARQTTTTTKPPNFGGRTFTYAANWSEPTNDARYMARKNFLEKTYNCKIKHLPLLDANARTNLTSSIKAGKPVADFFTQGPGVYNYAKDGMIYPFSSLKSIDINDPKWNKLIKDYSTINGKVYGIYWKQNVFRNVLLYNKSLIKGADDLYTLQKNKKLTWDKLFDIAKKVKAKGVDAISGSMDINDFTNLFVAANDGKMAKRGKGTDFTYIYDSKNTRNALKVVQEWYKADLLLDVGSNTYLYAYSQFYKGRLGMIACDNWQMSEIFAKAKFDVGAVLFPKGPDAKYDLVEQNMQEFYMMPSTLTNEGREQVGQLINAMADYDIKNDPTWKEIWGDMIDYDKEVLDTFQRYLDAIDKGQYFMDYRDIIQGPIYDNGVYGMLAEVARGDLTPQAYLDSIGPVCKAIIADYNKK
jgi:hypothetical protein